MRKMNQIDTSDLSIVFSIKIDSADRLENLRLNLAYIGVFFQNCEVIIVEQDQKSQIAELVSNRPGVQHYFIPSGDAHYKTRNLNHATNLATRSLVMMCDCDVICPPEALARALQRLREDAAFVSPHNGLLVNISKQFIRQAKSVSELVAGLVYFPKNFNLDLERFDYTHMAPLYGCSTYNSTGGCILYRKKDFYLIGGWNTNFFSYGFEDMEFVHRLQKLGYRLEMLDDNNLYHFDHERKSDSVYNNFFRSNEAEWENVVAMDEAQLTQYALNGFRKLTLTNARQVHITNTAGEYSIRSREIDKIDLGALSIILPLCVADPAELPALEVFLDYLEEYYKDYVVLMVEGQYRNCKYLHNKKNTQYLWLGTQKFDYAKAVEAGMRSAATPYVGIWDFYTLIEPAALCRSLKALGSEEGQVRLEDQDWYVSGAKKARKGTGLKLMKK